LLPIPINTEKSVEKLYITEERTRELINIVRNGREKFSFLSPISSVDANLK
jgi:hypothetical protein